MIYEYLLELGLSMEEIDLIVNSYGNSNLDK